MPALNACQCPHSTASLNWIYQSHIRWNPNRYNCECPKAATFDFYFQTESLIDVANGYCYCPQGTVVDSNSQKTLIWDPTTNRCLCPVSESITLNNTKEKTLMYDPSTQICLCETSSDDPNTHTVYDASRGACVCKNNLAFLNSTTAECGCPHGTDEPTDYQVAPTFADAWCVCP